MARFASEQGSHAEAINTLADLTNMTGQAAYTTDTTAGAVTATAAQFVNGVYHVSGTPGAFTLTTPTAAAIVAAIPNAQVGSIAWFWLINAGDGTVTLADGTGVDLVGTTTAATTKSRLYMIRVLVATSGAEDVDVIGVLLGDN